MALWQRTLSPGLQLEGRGLLGQGRQLAMVVGRLWYRAHGLLGRWWGYRHRMHEVGVGGISAILCSVIILVAGVGPKASKVVPIVPFTGDGMGGNNTETVV